MSENLDLLGAPLRPALQENAMLSDWQDLVGHTIKAIIENPAGRRSAEALIVTELGCWLAIDAESDGDSEPYVTVLGGRFSATGLMIDFASPMELLNAGLVNQGQYEHLMHKARAAKAADARARAEKLRREADALDPPKPAGQAPKGGSI